MRRQQAARDPVEGHQEAVRGLLELFLGVPGVGASPTERDRQDDVQGLPILFLAHCTRNGRKDTVETLCQPHVLRKTREEECVKCKLCGREAVSDLCRYHEKVKRKVEADYSLWVEAYGEIEWKDYLDKVKHNEQTGQWAKEIAEMLEGLQSD